MDPDEFIKEVSTTEVLTTEEAFNLILQMKGSAPRRVLPFSSETRSGVWKEEFFNALSIPPQGQPACVYDGFRAFGAPMSNITTTHIPFQIAYCEKDKVLIKSVYIINPTNCSLNKVSIQVACEPRVTNQVGTIYLLENRSHIGHQLYEVKFPPHVTMKTNDTGIIMAEYSGNPGPTLLQGQRAIGDPKKGQQQNPYQQGVAAGAPIHHFKARRFERNFKAETQGSIPEDVTIVMQNNPWHLVVGFKYKVR